MNYINVYSTKDDNEVAVLKNVYEEEGINYLIEEGEAAGSSAPKRIMVAEEDRTKARELLDQTGFVTLAQTTTTRRNRFSRNRWIFFFLAALILLMVAMLIVWFMNVE